MPKQKTPPETQAEWFEEYQEIKEFLYRKFGWVSEVEKKRIKRRLEKYADDIRQYEKDEKKL